MYILQKKVTSVGEKTVAALALLFSIHRYCTFLKSAQFHLSTKKSFSQVVILTTKG